MKLCCSLLCLMCVQSNELWEILYSLPKKLENKLFILNNIKNHDLRGHLCPVKVLTFPKNLIKIADPKVFCALAYHSELLPSSADWNSLVASAFFSLFRSLVLSPSLALITAAHWSSQRFFRAPCDPLCLSKVYQEN